MDDHDVVHRIDELLAEEHRLRDSVNDGHRLDDADRERLRELEVRLDQLWDLLRRRRARQEFRQDPNLEALRPGEVVEGYEQ